MNESYKSPRKLSGNFLRNVALVLLPSDERNFDLLPRADVAEYTGPRYDDPIQIAQMRARLNEIEFQTVTDSVDLIV